MSRRHRANPREVLADPRYGDVMVTKFTHALMRGGAKSVAERVLYGAFDRIAERTNQDPLTGFRQAVENIKPDVETRSRRVGGSTYQIPVEVRPARRQALAIRWLIEAARARSERTMLERLAGEFTDAASARGAAYKKRENTHSMARANRAFSHYRW